MAVIEMRSGLSKILEKLSGDEYLCVEGIV